MADVRFQICQLLYCYGELAHVVMGKEPVLMWPYLSLFVKI